MCGFTGFIDKISNKEKILKDSLETIKHRGPDSEGIYIDDNIALGFRRLSIIDLDAGKQPMFNGDESLVIVFNGEIYNYLELKKDLIKKGHIFKTNSDTEVLLHGYEEFGELILDKLRGMFSFVIWDINKKEMFGARDMFGIKPFYYAIMPETFLFSSEIKSMLNHPNFKKELNEEQLEHYLSFQYSIENETMFNNVYKLMPGHCFLYKNGNLNIKKYYNVEFNEREYELDDLIKKIQSEFEESVKSHLISDVEVGSFLSSGIDSSYVASTFGGSKTFTVGFDYHKYNEISYAKKLSKHIGVENISKTISSDEYFEEFPKVQYHMDEPLADPAAVALYFVSKKASEHVKVVLSGEGADEFFGGYNIYKEPLSLEKYQKLPNFLRKINGGVATMFPNIKGKNFLIRGSKTVAERYIGNTTEATFNVKERKKVLLNNKNVESPKAMLGKYFYKVKDKDDVTKMQYLDVHSWLVSDILLKADKMSMASSLELRVPFLDRKMFDLGSSIPLNYKVNSENTKYALRLAANEKLPTEVANKKKLGFPVPVREWLKEEKYYNKLKKEFNSIVSKKYFNNKYINNLLEEHYKLKKDNSRKIWTIYTFLVWYNQFFKECDK